MREREGNVIAQVVENRNKETIYYIIYNTVENNSIDGIYHWVSKDHLQSYIDEFTLPFNPRKFDTQSRFDLILSAVA